MNYFAQQGLPAESEGKIADDVITFCQKFLDLMEENLHYLISVFRHLKFKNGKQTATEF